MIDEQPVRTPEFSRAMYVRPEPTNVSDVVGKITKAMEMVSALSQGKQRWVMSVPAQPDGDPDLVISSALHAALSALADAERERDEAREANNGWRDIDERAISGERILLLWKPFGGMKEHVELGWFSQSAGGWVNTYGKPFHSAPDKWAALAPFTAAESTLSSQASLLEEARRVIELADALANQVRAVLFHLNGQAYSSTISAMNAFDAASLRLSKLGASNDA